MDEVLGLIDDDDDEPMTEGSEDEMDDLELDTDEMRVEADDDESITQTTTHTPVMSTSTCDVYVQEGSIALRCSDWTRGEWLISSLVPRP